MSTQTTYAMNAEFPFIADPSSISRGNGAVVNFDAWGAGYQNSEGKKVLPAGTICAVDATTKQLEPPAAGGGDAEVVLATVAEEDAEWAALSGYGVIYGGILYDDLMPDNGHTDYAAMKTALNTAGPGFRFVPYNDSRSS